MNNEIEAVEGGYWVKAMVFKTSDAKDSLGVMFDSRGRNKKKVILAWNPAYFIRDFSTARDNFQFLHNRGIEHRWFVDKKWINKKLLKIVVANLGHDMTEEQIINECTEVAVILQTRLSDVDAVEYKMFFGVPPRKND